MPSRPDGRIDVSEAVAWLQANMPNTLPPRLRAGEGASSEAGPTDAAGADAAAGPKPTPAQAPAPPAQGPVTAKQELDAVKVALLRLELAEKEGRLVDRRAVESIVFQRARADRDAWLSWVARVAPSIAAAVGCDVADLQTVLEAAAREHLNTLARMPLEVDCDAAS